MPVKGAEATEAAGKLIGSLAPDICRDSRKFLGVLSVALVILDKRSEGRDRIIDGFWSAEPTTDLACWWLTPQEV